MRMRQGGEEACTKGLAHNSKLTLATGILTEGMLIILAVTMFARWNAPEENSSLYNAWNGLYSDGVHTAAYIEENIGKD